MTFDIIRSKDVLLKTKHETLAQPIDIEYELVANLIDTYKHQNRRYTTMAPIIGAITFSVVIILSILIICGLPLGEFFMISEWRMQNESIKTSRSKV